MTDRTYVIICLLALLMPIRESWHLWPKDYVINPWLQSGPDIGIWWYIKGLSNSLVDLILAIIIYLLSQVNHHLRIVATVFLIYAINDLWLYVKNYNSASGPGYLIAYSFLPLFIIIAAYVKKHRSSYKQRELFKKIKDPVL